MAEDLRRFLADRPILARRAGPAESGLALVPAQPGRRHADGRRRPAAGRRRDRLDGLVVPPARPAQPALRAGRAAPRRNGDRSSSCSSRREGRSESRRSCCATRSWPRPAPAGTAAGPGVGSTAWRPSPAPSRSSRRRSCATRRSRAWPWPTSTRCPDGEGSRLEASSWGSTPGSSATPRSSGTARSASAAWETASILRRLTGAGPQHGNPVLQPRRPLAGRPPARPWPARRLRPRDRRTAPSTSPAAWSTRPRRGPPTA